MCVLLSLLFPLFNYNIIQEPFKYENTFILYQNASLVCGGRECASSCVVQNWHGLVKKKISFCIQNVYIV
jgi:hypothetical protein